MTGRQVKLFLVDGTPGGLTTAEITNWTGHVLAARRSDLAELLRREEADRTGIYLLLGDDDTATGDTRCYIGEAEVIASRLRQHAADPAKDFWERVVVITSKDANLTKAHGRYLESRLISLATQAGRVVLANGTAPPVPRLPEADASDMEVFISHVQIVLPVLGVNALRVRPAPAVVPEPSESPVFTLRRPKAGVEATAQQIDGEFTLLAGSQVIAAWRNRGVTDSTQRSYARYRERHDALVADGSIVVEGHAGRVTKDIVFSSPSTAAAVALGRSSNGRREWVAADGTTFGDWETRGLD